MHTVWHLKGNIHSYTKFTLNCWKYGIKSIFSGKPGNNNFVFQEIEYMYRLFSLFSFPSAAILDFMTSFGCRYCCKENLLCATIGQPYDVTKAKMAIDSRKILKAKIGDNVIQLFVTLKCYFHVFQKISISYCIANN